MAIKSFSVVTDYSTLNEITSKLNGANRHKSGSLNGMFTRREDFESSVKQLMRQLDLERMLALRFAEKGYSDKDFISETRKHNVRLHINSTSSTGSSSFDTYDLSPALRHFLNDYCRILEPLVRLLAQKHTNVSAQNTRRPTETISFNSYIRRLDAADVRMSLDHDYFIKLYDELWNDYKHAESSGVQASGWSSNHETITSEPKLYGSRLTYFKDMPAKEFIKKSLDNMNALLDYVA